jgi:hypothetical protein
MDNLPRNVYEIAYELYFNYLDEHRKEVGFPGYSYRKTRKFAPEGV